MMDGWKDVGGMLGGFCLRFSPSSLWVGVQEKNFNDSIHTSISVRWRKESIRSDFMVHCVWLFIWPELDIWEIVLKVLHCASDWGRTWERKCPRTASLYRFTWQPTREAATCTVSQLCLPSFKHWLHSQLPWSVSVSPGNPALASILLLMWRFQLKDSFPSFSHFSAPTPNVGLGNSQAL